MCRNWRIVVCLFSGLFSRLSTAQVEVYFNTNHYFGPDGPWQAIALEVGYPGEPLQPINVYPTFLWSYAAILAPTTAVCLGSAHGDCALGGGISPLKLDSPTDRSRWGWGGDKSSYYYRYYGNFTYMNVKVASGAVRLHNAKVGVVDSAYYQYPNGVNLPTEVGLGALGGGNRGSSRPANNGTSPQKALHPTVRSDTFGLHVGVAQCDYPGSLIYGGYNRGRLLGNVTSYNLHGVIPLLDIVIGVETGGSPFDFESKSGLLSGNVNAAEGTSQQTWIRPDVPYIFLPQVAIKAITAQLPVSFDEKSGYWLWDESSQHKRIVSSPAYLGFVFADSSSATGNMIKVPFALLNLTLSSTVSGQATERAYLPLMSSTSTPPWSWEVPTGHQKYTCLLGRAFLQAAFLGANWDEGNMWLAQAPAPASPIHVIATLSKRETPTPWSTSLDAFKVSWDGYLTPLPSKRSLKSEDIAGIILGVVGFLAALVGALFFFWRRKKNQRQLSGPSTSEQPETQQLAELKGPTVRYEIPDPDRGELTGWNFRREMLAVNRPGELYGTQPQPQELPAHPSGP